MYDPIVHSSAPITLVGGGEATLQDLQEALTLASTCVAVDSGAVLALQSSHDLAALIGDFDSLPSAMRAQIPPQYQHHIAEQDSTDFEKALSRVRAPLVVGVGFTGGRVDHQLAALHVLAKFAHQPCVLIGTHELIFLAPPHIALPTVTGEVVSLFPLAPVAGRSSGLKWNIDGLAFDPLRQIGTSNEATGPCEMTMQGPEMVMMVPRRLIQPVVSLLSQPHCAHWPARG